MKGTNKKKNNKSKKGGRKGGFNSSKRSRRAALHSGNAAYNAARKSRTKLKRVAATLPGTFQGKHLDKNPACRCGGCNTKDDV